jgi:hypothetical protein
MGKTPIHQAQGPDYPRQLGPWFVRFLVKRALAFGEGAEQFERFQQLDILAPQ